MPSAEPKESKGDAPSISVIVTAFTFDRLPSIEEIIESLRNQTVAPTETLLVIDYAPDLEEECRRRWPDVRVIPNRKERGSCGGRNTGVEESSGEIVAFLDDDAVPNHEWIERLGEDFADPRVIGVGGGINPRWLAQRPSWFPPEFDWVVGCAHSGMPKDREPVRNAIAANMAIRREEMLEIGGLRREFSRIEKNAIGGEETDLCIRLTQRWPERMILFDPVPAVEHFVPPERAKLRYFITRCFAEGRSKAALSRMVGSQSGLASERSYVRRTLPLGVLRNLGAVVEGDFAGIARAAAIVAGLATTVAGYVTAPRRGGSSSDDMAENGNRPLRLLTVTPRSPLVQGGVERHVMEVTRRVAAAGVEVEVLCTEPGGERLREEERDGVKIRVLRAWPPNRDWCVAPRLWGEIARARPDVIHVQSYHTAVAPLAMLRALTLRVPYVVTFHGGGHSSSLRNRLRRAQRLLMRPLFSRAARLIAVARFEIDQYGRELRLPPDRIALIPNGTETAFSAVAPKRDGQPIFATIGRLERYKGQHRVLAALPEVLRREPRAKLLIVGSGPYESDLRHQAAELDVEGAVEFTSIPADQPEAMSELLSRVSLVVLLSEFETHPLVALEAAAAGCRLLVADTGGLLELAEDGLARTVPLDESPARVGEAVVEELALPPQDKHPSLSSWDECADELLTLYRSLA